jgi:ribosome-binding protein aMBF1 (putative translation factor)
MADSLGGLRSDLEKRIREIEPLIEEHARLRQALEALKSAGGSHQGEGSSSTARRAASRPRAAAKPGRGRPRGSGARAQQVLKLVREQPGITIAELAQRLKIKPNYLYRVVPGLQKDGMLEKRDKGFHPPAD